jgi:hypothetical protein
MCPALFAPLVLHLSIAAPAPTPAPVPEELLKARRDAAQKTYQLIMKRAEVDTGLRGHVEELAKWSRRWLQAELALSEKKADQVAAYQAHLDRMKAAERFARSLVKTGMEGPHVAAAAEYHRIEAEIELVRAKGR